jgi:hypothetical protein
VEKVLCLPSRCRPKPLLNSPRESKDVLIVYHVRSEDAQKSEIVFVRPSNRDSCGESV